uniref:ABC-type branched-chain amino acid transport system, ATPase component n=1 Tax=Candidatus Kentrum sp. LFY TaxID=2126342 RepID=A0A450WDF1_9GAMM|nr:MAG: ABC-type branched-chain amino acid transport system, ATPase component [Candidatus Kentron sp. LFY]
MAVTGPPSCGKSTVLRAVFGRSNIISGKMQIEGHTVTSQAPLIRPWDLHLGAVWNPREVLNRLTINETFVVTGVIDRKWKWKFPMLQNFFGMTPLPARTNSIAVNLSGGERTLLNFIIAIHRAMGGLLIVDDLSASLQPTMANVLIEVLEELIELREIAVVFTEDTYRIRSRLATIEIPIKTVAVSS